MSASQHTPGPWKIEAGFLVAPTFPNAPAGPHFPLYEMARFVGSKAEDQADRALIAAAPEMLAALKLADAAMNHMGDALNGMDACEPEDEAACTPAFEAVRAVLAKLEG